MRKIIPVIGLTLALTACSSGYGDYAFQPAPTDAPEAQIRFVQHRGIHDYHAVSDRLLYVQSRDRRWYQVKMFAPCMGLEYAHGLRFLPSDGAGTFDRSSDIAIRDQRCKVESVKEVGPPLRDSRGARMPASRY
jgi:hypothetical protein